MDRGDGWKVMAWQLKLTADYADGADVEEDCEIHFLSVLFAASAVVLRLSRRGCNKRFGRLPAAKITEIQQFTPRAWVKATQVLPPAA
jgi:hypothetical protein